MTYYITISNGQGVKLETIKIYLLSIASEIVEARKSQDYIVTIFACQYCEE